MDKNATIAELTTQRVTLRSELDGLMETAGTEKRTLNEAEALRFDEAEIEIKRIDADVKRYKESADADIQSAETLRTYAPVPTVTVTSEPEVYRKGHYGHSYLRDLFRAQNKGDYQAAERLRRNDKMVHEQRTALSTTNGVGGEFVPPLWLETDFIKYARPGRITANLIPTAPLPGGTDSLNIPKVNTGTAAAIMNGQNTGVPETDLTTTSVASSVFTIAGGQTVSLQLMEQSPLNVDMVVLQDLSAAYAVALNTAVLTGSGSAGNPLGITNVSGINSIDVPSASFTAQVLNSKVAGAISAVHSSRYMSPDRIVMHPRRWGWLTAQSDSTGRPLVVPAAGTQGTGFNLLAEAAEIAAQGFVGTMQGLPVFVDALIPTNLTADSGTGEDLILVARFADLQLWESDIRAEAFQQTYAQNMSVYIRLYNYASFQPARYAQSISVLTGAGLAAPSF